ncbi:MAG: hypothetical protein H6Q31_2666, partial [Bacteroidetes bacterium]|nr:hypothetical protein [Bacteroidota bacterium]
MIDHRFVVLLDAIHSIPLATTNLHDVELSLGKHPGEGAISLANIQCLARVIPDERYRRV